MDAIRSQDGTSIAYQRSGTGPPLILVHGAVSDHMRWGSVLPMLEQHFTIFAMDRRGRGGSGDTEPYAIQREFEDVAALVDSVGEPVNLLGHSFGAVCSLEAALLTPNISKLILYEPPSPGEEGTLPATVEDRMQTYLDAGDRESVITTFLLEVARITPYELEMLRTTPSWAGRVAAAHTILREIHGLEALPKFQPARFKGITIPTLLLLGGNSPVFYRDATQAAHAALPNSKIVILPGQQHVAMTTAPDLFVREVLDFLTAAD